MKKNTFFIVLVIIVVSLLLMLRFEKSLVTIEEAITTPSSKPISIIHEEKTDKGSIVFYNHLDEDDLSTAFVKKNIFGYKTIYSGVQGDIKLVLEKFGLTYHYFPSIENTSLPIYFGIIGNPDISQVKIVEKKRNIEGQAKIINAKGTRIWLVFMYKYEGSDFEIVGLSVDGKEITKINDNISPYYAEQKPLEVPAANNP